MRPSLQYASPVWSPHWEEDKSALEKVQRRAARFIKRDYAPLSSPTQMLSSLSIPSLEQQRDYARAVMLYKIQHGLVAIPSQCYLCPRGRGDTLSFIWPHSRVNAHLYSFFPQSVRIWDRLGEVRGAPSLDAFKTGAAGVLLREV